MSSISYAGVPLTYVGSETQSDDARVEIWKLVDPSLGNHEVGITFSEDLERYAVAGVVTFTRVNQSHPLGEFTGNNDTSSLASLTLPSGSDELVLSVFSCETCESVTFLSPAEAEWVVSAGEGVEIGAGATQQGAGPEVTINAPLVRSDHWAMGGVSVKPRLEP